ncbi:MAG: hypothetical protein LBK42_14480 [Propionibacteriaceae bacterium]|nr:hypothetical protein [Propionibacteriaceae bacterium]
MTDQITDDSSTARVPLKIIDQEQLKEIKRLYQEDMDFARQLEADPKTALAEHDLDREIPCLADCDTLGDLLARTPAEAYAPTLESLNLLVTHPGYEVPKGAGANVSAAVNAVVVANAVGYHEAVVAEMGAVGLIAVVGLVAVIVGAPPRRTGLRVCAPSLRLADTFEGEEVFQFLSSQGLGEARQFSTLRRGVLDGEIIETYLTDDGFENRTTRYEFDGSKIEIDSLIGVDEITILRCSVKMIDQVAVVV